MFTQSSSATQLALGGSMLATLSSSDATTSAWATCSGPDASGCSGLCLIMNVRRLPHMVLNLAKVTPVRKEVPSMAGYESPLVHSLMRGPMLKEEAKVGMNMPTCGVFGFLHHALASLHM